MVDYSKQGKRNKQSGAEFEKRVRADLESKGWIVSKWQNNVEFSKVSGGSADLPQSAKFETKLGKCVPSKPGKYRMMQTGFPDFIAYRIIPEDKPKPLLVKVNSDTVEDLKKTQERLRRIYNEPIFISNNIEFLERKETEIIFIECKTNGYLSKEEKEKARWYL